MPKKLEYLKLHKKSNELKQKLEHFHKRISLGRKTNFIIRTIIGVNLNSLSEKKRQFAAEFLSIEQNIKELRDENNHLKDQLREIEYNINLLLGDPDVKQLFGNGENITNIEIESKLEKLETKIKEKEEALKRLETAILNIQNQIIHNALVMGTTLTRAYLNEDINENRFDVVVVDEASMVTPPSLFCSCLLATSKAVIVGDFYQLPPIAISDEPQVKKWLKRDIFEINEIPEKISKGIEDNRLVKLTEQRRMSPEIADIVNESVYKGSLKNKNKWKTLM